MKFYLFKYIIMSWIGALDWNFNSVTEELQNTANIQVEAEKTPTTIEVVLTWYRSAIQEVFDLL